MIDWQCSPPRLVALLALCVASASPSTSLGQTPFWAELAEPGQYGVGIRVAALADASRSYRDRNDRPLPAWVWYPAARTGVPLSYRRYVEMMADEAALGDAGEEARRLRAERWMAGLERQRAGLGERMASLRTAAVLNATPVNGAFPMVVYVPGAGGSALENVVLAELLASSGYVVAAIPSLGANDRIARTTLRDLEAQARDIRFTAGAVADLTGQPGTKVVAMGWSWGGLASMLAQMQDSRIGAVVSLDGSIGVHRDLAERVPEFAAARAQVPYLMLLSKNEPGAAPGFFLDLRYSDAYYVAIDSAAHTDFTTRWGYLDNIAQVGTSEFDSSVPATYGTVLRAVRSFLGRAAADTGGPTARLSIEAIGAKPGTELRHRPANPPPPAPYRFLETLRRSTAEGWTVYRAVKALDPAYRLADEQDLVELAFELFNRLNRPNDAIEVGRLLVEEFPASYSAHGYLAELYRKHQQWAAALSEFGAAYALGRAGQDTVWTTREGSLAYYRRMIEELRARLDAQPGG